MRTYPRFNKKGIREPVFEIDNIYIAPATVARVLAAVEGVADVKVRRMFSKPSDIRVQFKYLGRPYIVWEPFGDNSRYWIGPADMLSGVDAVAALDSPNDICRLEDAFKHYRPPFHRALLGLFGDVLTLRFIRGKNNR